MAIEAEAPDGTILEFPDDTPDDVIDRTMKAHIQKSAPAPKPQTSMLDDVMSGPIGQVGYGALEGLSSLPGLPVEAGVLLGNLAGSAFGKQWKDISEDPNLKDWGAQGWYESAQRNLGVPKGPDAVEGLDRSARKAGIFAGGALPFGPRGMVPAATAFLGSEAGRGLDQAGVTGGYGEGVGALLGGMAPGVVKGIATSGIRRGVPTNEQLKATAKQAYDAADNAGVMVPPESIGQLATNAKQVAADFAFDPALQPGVKVILDRLDDAAQGNVTLKGIDTIRKMAGNVARDGTNPSQRELASRLIDQVDDYIDNLKSGDVLSGDPQTAAASLKVARDSWKKLRKSEMIDEALSKAERRAASGGVGGNADNATRQNIRAILDNPKKSKLFSKEERALMDRVVRGTTPQNALRMLGRFSPETGNLAAWLGIGSTALLPGGAALPIAGAIAKPIADSLTSRNVSRLSALVRGGKAPAMTAREQANAMLLEMQRRAKLAQQSAAPAIPGALSYQEQR